MTRYFIEDYHTGLTILDKNKYYTKYFNSIKNAENFINSLKGLNKDDNFYIVKEVNGQKKPIEF
tara:strand:- start:1492 stop:1683 length:192 start_codon:yes stop_codon:yes gene_type:complete